MPSGWRIKEEEDDSQEKGEIPREVDDSPRGRRRFPEEGDAQRIPKRDAQRKRMPGGRGCPEEVDVWRTWMPGGEDTFGTPQRS